MSAEAAPASPAAYTKLGSGTFGAVISPALPNTKNGATVEFPGNVTKIFFKRRDKQKLLEKLPTVQRVIGSYPEHRINNYSRSYTFRNLHPNAQRILRNTAQHQILPTNNVHVVHMPYLGIDISDRNLRDNRVQLRNIPVVKIIEEIVKLISQTANLAESGYVHGDIRETNIMIHPESGSMSLIDFDWIKPYEDFMDTYPFGYYSNPPEYLLFDNFNYYIDTENIEDIIDMRKLNDYVKHQYSLIFWTHGMNVQSRDAFRSYVFNALIQNARILKMRTVDIQNNYYDYDDASKDVFISNLKTFDNFGLATSLLCMLSYLYPASITVDEISNEESPEIKERIKESMRERISKHGIHYNDEELDVIVLTLRKLSYLLYLMGNMKLTLRPTPAQALREARAILNKLVTSISAINSREAGAELSRMAVMAGNLSALPTMNGGHRTHRRVLKRSKKTRRLRPTK